ncbi:MAG: DMT family transporter [Pseudomonadota bacterium]
MERKTRIDAFGATSLIIFSALLGLNQVLIKIVNSGLNPVFQAGLRSLFALPIVLLFMLVARKKLSFTDGSLLAGLFCGLLFSGEFILLFLALDFTTVSRASIFFYTMPFWVALGAHFFIPDEALTRVRVFGLVLAIAGIAIAMANRSAEAPAGAFWGDLMSLAGATMWAGIALVARLTRLSKSSPQMQLVYQLVVSAPLILLASLFFGPAVRELTSEHIFIFAFQVVVVVAFGFSFWFWLLARYPASDMASFGFLAPLFGVALGWLILDEQVTGSLIIALILVACGIYLVNRKPKTAV